MKHRLGVCSWSLRTEELDPLAARIREVGVRFVQLGLDPVVQGDWQVADVQRAFDAAGVEILSGMMGMKGEDYSTLETIRETGGIRPTEHWEANLAAARGCAQAAQELGLDLVSFHAGFLPHDRADSERAVLIDRVRRLAEVFAERDVRLAFETGQETGETLLGVLDEIDRTNVGVNFDPANMILYGMGDPVAALRTLGGRVLQVHIKDATPSAVPGTWGAEVPVGTGAVDWRAFFTVLDDHDLVCDLMIEREAGEERVQDMRAARGLLEQLSVVEGNR
jgi:sugar phosphate isomerase/epimerase